MKVLLALVVVVAAVVAAPKQQFPVEETTAFDYHNRVGIPEAKRIRLAEEELANDPSRIVGGNQAAAGAHAHLGGLIVTLTTGLTSVCGSTLLSNTRLVTAAHCWWDGRSQARQFQVVLGSGFLFSGGTRINTTNVLMHANWNPNNLSNDIAIIVISRVTYTNNILRAILPTGSSTHAGTTAWAAGYGLQNQNGSIGNNQSKHQVRLPVITNAVCQQTFGDLVTASTLCASGANGRSTCGGDSGGPLAVITSVGATPSLIGITSFGSQAGCQSGFPAAFTRVTSFNSWINARL